jgi:hypothetical protein
MILPDSPPGAGRIRGWLRIKCQLPEFDEFKAERFDFGEYAIQRGAVGERT